MGGTVSYLKKNKPAAPRPSTQQLTLASLPSNEEKKAPEYSSVRIDRNEEKLTHSPTSTQAPHTYSGEPQGYPKSFTDLIENLCKKHNLIEFDIYVLMRPNMPHLNHLEAALTTFFTHNLPCTKKIIASLVKEAKYAEAITQSILKLQKRLTLTEPYFTPIIDAGFFAPTLCDIFLELCKNRIQITQKIFDTLIKVAPADDVHNIMRALIQITTYLVDSLNLLQGSDEAAVVKQINDFLLIEKKNASTTPHAPLTFSNNVKIDYINEHTVRVKSISLNHEIIDAIALADEPEELATALYFCHANDVSLSLASLKLLARNSVHAKQIFTNLKTVKDEDVRLSEAETQQIINAKDLGYTTRKIITQHKSAKAILGTPTPTLFRDDERKTPSTATQKSSASGYSLHRIFKKQKDKKPPENNTKTHSKSHSHSSR